MQLSGAGTLLMLTSDVCDNGRRDARSIGMSFPFVPSTYTSVALQSLIAFVIVFRVGSGKLKMITPRAWILG